MKNFTTYLIVVFVVWVIMTGRLSAFVNVVSKERWNFSASLFPDVISGGGGSSSGGSGAGGIASGLGSVAGGGSSGGGGFGNDFGTAASVASIAQA